MLCQVTWSADGSKIYANCQENSAIVTIDVATATATSIHAMPLKDWSAAGGTEGIDTEKDGACESMQRVLLMLSGRRGAPRATLNSPLATSPKRTLGLGQLSTLQRSYRGEPRLHSRCVWCPQGGPSSVLTPRCELKHKPGFKTMRTPDAVAVMQIDGTDYIVTANEGDDKEYGTKVVRKLQP